MHRHPKGEPELVINLTAEPPPTICTAAVMSGMHCDRPVVEGEAFCISHQAMGFAAHNRFVAHPSRG